MLDILIKNGKIIDGSGSGSFVSDIGIKNGRIAKIATRIEEESRNIINAQGFIVTPGFIDVHSHSDFTLYINSFGESKIRQGITTEVVGNCGFTAAPVNIERFDELKQYLLNTVLLSEKEEKYWKWKTQKDFVEELASKGLSMNIASLVGHGTIRVSAMGFAKRKPTNHELNQMIKMLETELEQGLFGMSTGLQYEPGSFADTEELVELSKVLADYNAVYTTHLRSEGKYLLESISQAVEIADKSGVSVEISHLKAQNPSNWGKVKDALRVIEHAKKRGCNIDFDVYPYLAFGSGLIDLVPPWVRESGTSKMVEILKTKRAQVIKEMMNAGADWDNPLTGTNWDKIRIASLRTESNKKYEGLTIEQIARDMACSPYHAVINLLIEEQGAIKIIFFAMCEDDLITVMNHPGALFCTDGRAVAPYGELAKGKVHPRYYGTYPRILGHYVRELGLMTLEEAIKKMTYLPALKFNLIERGLIKEGYYADITIFDQEEIIDNATFDDPHQYSSGVKYVLVNGKTVISQGNHTGILPGEVLYRS